MTLKEYLLQKGLKIKPFAKLIKISQCHASQIVNDKKRPGWNLARRIEQFSGGQVPRTNWFPNE